MHTTGKWLVRGGALLILLGFFMPSVLVSCTAMPGVGQPMSLSQLASDSVSGQPLVYLAPLGALAAIAFAFLPGRVPRQRTQFVLAQILGLVLGALSILGALISLYSQMGQFGLTITPAIGMYVLILGYGFATTGIVLQIQENPRMGIPFSLRETEFSPPPIGSHQLPFPSVSGPRLEVVSGRTMDSVIAVYDGFVIGRSRQANLPLEDRSVSVQHARLRFAQGTWFLQDQSSNGTFVNGEQISATRLNPGDQIRIGDTTFIFRI
jgi:FHA domain